MPIVLSRIDDRLIHGQIVEGWLRGIQADCIIVVSDEVAKDKMQQTLLSMAAPTHIKVKCLSIFSGSEKLQDGSFEEDNVLLLFSCPQDVLSLVKSGVGLKSVNVGGMHYVTGKKQILRNLSIDESDVAALKELNSLGIELEGRVLPNDERISIIDVLNKGIR